MVCLDAVHDLLVLAEPASEVRVIVKPDEISDADATVLARELAKQIEDELQYPGQIKVMIIRESRAVEYAK